MRRALPFVALALAIAAAALTANLLLLRSAGGTSDPVGKLSPVAPALVTTATVPIQPPATTTDDQHGRGHDGDD